MAKQKPATLVLIYTATGADVKIGDTAYTFDGTEVKVLGWMEPRHPGSTGRVYVKTAGIADAMRCEFYPSVIGAEWVSR